MHTTIDQPRHHPDWAPKQGKGNGSCYDSYPQFGRMQIPITPLVIQFATPFPYESEKVVPWRYEPKVYKQGHESKPLVIIEPTVTSIVGPGGMTRSGRVFSQRTVEVANDTSVLAHNTESQGGSLSPKDVVSLKEVEEFLRIIRKIDYKVVDQLNQTPSKFSMLSLFLSS